MTKSVTFLKNVSNAASGLGIKSCTLVPIKTPFFVFLSFVGLPEPFRELSELCVEFQKPCGEATEPHG